MLASLLSFLLIIASIFLICLVLIQRGKGGGLAGAFGGVGGSSAFGTKAGDVFTRITIVTAGVWFLLAILLVVINNQERRSAFDLGDSTGPSTKVALPGEKSATPKPATTPASNPAGSKSAAPPVAPATLPSALEDVSTPEPTKPTSLPPAKPAEKP